MALPLESHERKVVSVGDLTRRIKRSVEDAIRQVWVAGEISNLRPASSGHVYFTLKDEESQIPCVMWRSASARLRFRPEDGMEVVAFGRVEVYLPHGKYQLVVDDLEPRGVGSLQIRFEQLKERLQREGLFDPSRKRPLPFFPRKLALVTSPTGAAVQDMLRTIRARCPLVHVLVYAVRVQGDGSAQEIAAAIGHLNLAMPDLDVLIVGRGGGSIEDLWAFNEEVVARAIHASRIPVVSAVGHETDTTIADFVADVRALTPTDGAVKTVPKLGDILLSLDDLERKVKRSLATRAQLARAALDGLAGGRALGRIEELPARLAQRLDELRERLDQAARQTARPLRDRLDLLRASLHADLPRMAEGARRRAEHLVELLRSYTRRAAEAAVARLREAEGTLQALSPVAILERGYSITRLESTDEILRDAAQAGPGDRLLTRLASGTLTSEVRKT